MPCRGRPDRWLLLFAAVACSARRPVPPSPPPAEPAARAAPDAGPGRPTTRAEPVTDVLFGQRVADPYRWLEDEKSAEVQAWMAAQDAQARAFLDAQPARAALAQRLDALFYVGAIGVPAERGGRLFFTRRAPRQEKAVLCWRDGDAGQERVLLDPNTWAGGTVSLGTWVPSWDGKRVVFAQHPNNADEAVLHVVEVDTGRWSEVDLLEGGKYAQPNWTPDGRGFYYTYLPDPPGTPVADRPGLAEVRLHTLGQPQARDVLVRGPTHDASTFVTPSLSRDGKVLLVYIWHGWTRSDVFLKRLGRDADLLPLAVGRPALYSVDVWKDHLYIATDEGASRKRVFRASVDHPERGAWKEIVPEDPEATLVSTAIVGGKLSLEYLRNATSELRLVSLLGKPDRRVPLPELGSASNLSGLEDRPTAYFAFTSFTRAQEIYRTDVRTGATSLWARVEVPVDPERYRSDQIRYPSKDGTEATMFVVRRKDLPRDGTAPAVLTGYGG
ncbi:MAG TPA: S9 family peptidase, partial [Myxococcaceae bacterium]|nr:S9 family peptidase [Myxococcaceae bacterium]